MDQTAAWQRVAELIIARRIELDPEYRNRRTFAQATGVEERLLSDIERSRRTNYSPETIARFEQALQWAPGSIRAILEGGSPTLTGSTAAQQADPADRLADPLPRPPADAPSDIVDNWADYEDWERQLWYLPLPVEIRWALSDLTSRMLLLLAKGIEIGKTQAATERHDTARRNGNRAAG